MCCENSNHAYGAQIGVKHPAILGMRYDVAWSEVWAELGPVVAGAMNGHVVHVDNAQMFLKRGNLLEGKCMTPSVSFEIFCSLTCIDLSLL